MYTKPISLHMKLPEIQFHGVFGVICVALLVLAAAGLSVFSSGERPRPAAHVVAPLIYSFNAPGILNEAGRMDHSTSPYWWLNSGGQMIIEGGFGKTMQGEASPFNKWRLLYALTNQTDTDSGTHPQNIFRLVSRSLWGNTETRVSFRITNVNLSDSPNRNASNGVLLLGRYYDDDNTYYAGIRDDGLAIIKKKIHGVYYTLGSVQIFGTPGKYDRKTVPTLLPQNSWMALKMTIQNAWDGSVLIRLYLDRENDGSFVSILSARDLGMEDIPLREAGYVGIRTDFKDVEFDSFRAEEI
ncbi:MAG: hypothetical protein NUV59_03690 [Patescibacteria group bacterium]|nr:hypothetical protein [Patescibacteria group bacterium]